MTFRHLAVAKSKRTLRLHHKSLLRSMNTIGVGTTRGGGFLWGLMERYKLNPFDLNSSGNTSVL